MRTCPTATGDKSALWDGHKAIVEREALIVQQMTNLGALPLSGFMVGFFPIKLARCSARAESIDWGHCAAGSTTGRAGTIPVRS